jgi:hypothetical protein
MKHSLSGEAKKQSGTTWLIYGASGCGKTPLASLFPHPWFWDFEGGVQSMIKDDVLISHPENYAEVLGLLQIAQSSTPGSVVLDGQRYPFCSLIVDTTAEMSRTFEKSAKGSKEQATLPEWYLTVERTRNVTRSLRNLAPKGFNIVFITHEQYVKSEVEVYQGLPDMPGKELPNDLPKLMDVVGHLRWNQTQNGLVRELVCEPHGVYVGRDRRGLISRFNIDLKDARGLEKLLVEKGGAHHVCASS